MKGKPKLLHGQAKLRLLYLNRLISIAVTLDQHFYLGSSPPCGLRCGCAAACLMGLWVRIPPGACLSFSCEHCVLSGRCLCVGLITYPEEYCRVWCAFSVIVNPSKGGGRHVPELGRTTQVEGSLYVSMFLAVLQTHLYRNTNDTPTNKTISY
jgi:hypothetical protein